jgi:putative FmdB family regulatory protein
MPLYEYLCDACGQRFERIQKFTDPPPEQCAKCGKGPVHKQHSSPAIQFKGSGFYITDYAKKGSGSGDSSAAGKSEKSESGGADSKSGASKDGPSKDSASQSGASQSGASQSGASQSAGTKSGGTKSESAAAAPAAKPASEN